MGHPVVYMTCHLVKQTAQCHGFASDTVLHKRFTKPLHKMLRNLRTDLKFLDQNTTTLSSVNRKLYNALYSLHFLPLVYEPDEVSDKQIRDAHSKLVGSIAKIKCAEKVEENGKSGYSRPPPLTRDRALGAYAWTCARLSYEHHNCVACSAGKRWAFNCYDDLLNRPDYFQVPAERDCVTVHPEDEVKAALYQNLLTLYATHAAANVQMPMDVMETWEQLLFPAPVYV
jgi:hypothetical protein